MLFRPHYCIFTLLPNNVTQGALPEKKEQAVETACDHINSKTKTGSMRPKIHT